MAFAATISPADDPNLPDLVSDPVENPVFDTQVVDGEKRRLLRFDGFVHNAGSSKLEMVGSRPAGSDWRSGMTSITQTGHGTARPGTTMRFENADGHNHWHLGRAAGYQLVGPTSDAEVAPGMKVGFCLLDSERREGSAPQIPWAQNHQCESPTYGGQGTSATDLTMTLSPGWRDFYGWDVWLQWVDISNVQPGPYRLRSTADPDDLIAETQEANPPADVPIEVEGWTAKPVTVAGAERNLATTVTLAADEFDEPSLPPAVGDVEYRIESRPANGTIDRAPGTWSTDPRVTFTPDAGTRSSGAAEITFSAREVDAQFPLSPATAKATVSLVDQIDAASPRPWIAVGDSVQLAANAGGVTWSKVSGPGTVSASGSFTSSTAGTAVLRAARTADPANRDDVTVEVKPSLQITPESATVEAGQSRGFGANDPDVDWSADRGSFSGTTYTAPATAGPDTVTATHRVDGRTDSVPVTVLAAFTVGPTPAEVQGGQTLQLTSTVPVKTWSVRSGGGSVSSSGVYSAPATRGTAVVRAEDFDGRTRDTTISITDTPTPVVISPAAPTITEGETIDLQSSVDGVTWTKVSGPGTLTAGGRYTAPDPFAGTVVITADKGDGRSDTVTVTIVHKDLQITPSATVEEGGTTQLASNVDGVTWEVLAGPGSVSASGRFTATSPGTATVRAAIDTRADESVITVTAKDLVVSTPRAWLYPTETMQLGATPGDAVSWSKVAGGGELSPGGVYTAPDAPAEDVTVRGTRYGRTSDATFDVAAPPAVTIVGAPGEMYAGTARQLSATSTSVRWETDLGSITPGGEFTAPSTAGGTATVRIVGPYGATDTVAIKIVSKPPVVPIPGGDPELLTPASPQTDMAEIVPPTSSPSRKRRRGPAPTFDKLGAKLTAPYVTVSLRPGRSGRLRLSLVRGTRWLQSCTVTARAGKAISCRMKVKGSTRNLRIVATFRATGRKPMVKRMSVKGSRQTLRR